MKVFVSYSFQDSELYIVALLLEELRQKGFIIETADPFSGVFISDYKIMNSDFFIGIITNNSESINSVIREWRIAQDRNVRNILVIEEGVMITNQNLNHIRFNRNDPQAAINQLLQRTRQRPTANSPALEDAVAFGAIVVGVAALISLLSEKK